jgi:hypothetical protein
MTKTVENFSFNEDLETLERMTQPKDLFRLAGARRIALEQRPRRTLNFYWFTAVVSGCLFTIFMLFPTGIEQPETVNLSNASIESHIVSTQGTAMMSNVDLYYWLDIYDK